MKLHRSALFAGLMALGLAACGDDVQVVDPPPAPPPPLVVSVSPQNQQILVGQTADFTVNISGGADGVAATWTCVSGNTAFVGTAVVTATGCRVTGVAVGSTTVTASVTKGTQSASAGGQITVSQIPVEPAQISIAQLTQNGVSAILTAVRGQLNVIVNVVANDETPSRVSVRVSGVEVAAQTIAAGAMAEAVEGPDGQFFVPIELSFPTDYYGGMFPGDVVTGVARHLNLLHTIQAFLEVTQRPGDPTASNTVQAQFANFNRVHISETGAAAHQTKLPTNSAFAANGAIWYGGPSSGNVSFRAFPVIYQPNTPGGNTPRVVNLMNIGFGACGADPAAPKTAPPFDYTFTCTGVEAAGNAPFFVVPTMATDGAPVVFGGFALVPVLNVVPAIVGPNPFPVNIDKVAPSSPSPTISFVSSNGNRENWGNEDYPVAAGYTTAGDAGVGIPAGAPANGMERRFRIRMGTTTQFTGAFGASPALGATGIAVSANNSTYNLGVEAIDRLGNVTGFINQIVASVVTPPAFLAQCGAAPCQLTASSSTSNNLSTFGYDPDDPMSVYTNIGVGSLGPTSAVFPPPALSAVSVSGSARQYVFNTVPGGTNFEYSATDVISGFAAPGTPVGSRALFNSHVSVLATVNSAGGAFTAAGLANLIGTSTISTTPFGTSAAGTGFVNTPANSAGYVQTPTSITTAAGPAVLVNGGVIATPIQEVYQARARDRAGNLAPIIAWHVYTNNATNPIFTGLIAQGLFFGGIQATFPGTSQDGPGPVFGNEVREGSFDLEYPAVGHLVYERPNPAVSTLFDDIIFMPQNINFQTGGNGVSTGTAPSFIRALQGVTAVAAAVSIDGEPVTGGTPTGAQVKPNVLTGRAYNGTLVGIPSGTFQCHNFTGAALTGFRPCHINNLAPLADAATGTSAHAGAPIISTQVETGTAFSGAVGPLNIANFYISSITVSAPSGAAPNVVRTATVTIRARGPTITFNNPFPGGLVVVERIGTGPANPGADPYYRPISGTLTPNFLPGLPSLDNGVIRDFNWTFVFTLPAMTGADGILTTGDREIRAIGLSTGFDGLVSSGAMVPFDATVATTTAVGITYVP